MALPVVAIIGRPNVGKSSLMNALAGEMISIVEPTAGVTRDRVSTIIEHKEKYFELVDTGGYGIVDSDMLNEHVEHQIEKAISSADIVLFMVDIRDGIMALDQKIAQLLRKKNLTIIGVANKADTAKLFPQAGEFIKLGFGEFLCISATNNMNKNVLLDTIFEKLKDITTEIPAVPEMKIAIVGKRNTGKSSLVNAIVGDERVIVSEVPGTTRDAVDVRFVKDGKIYVVIDTAGVRKKGRIVQNDIEYYSHVRVTKAVMRADVVLFMIDSTVPISQVDKKLASFITEEYKTCIIVINKWDLAKEKATSEDYEQYLTKILPMLKFAPIAFTTATEKKNIKSLLDLASNLYKQATTWIPTPRLNDVIEQLKEEKQGKIKGSFGAGPKIYYATQVAVNPVTLLMFVNRPDEFDDNFKKYLSSKLSAMLGLDDVPIRLLARGRERKEDSQNKNE